MLDHALARHRAASTTDRRKTIGLIIRQSCGGSSVNPRELAEKLIAIPASLEPCKPLLRVGPEWASDRVLEGFEDGVAAGMNDQGLIVGSGSVMTDGHVCGLRAFDRASMPMHAGTLTREGVGHSGVILFRRSISTIAYGRQARLLVDLMEEAKDWDWSDRIEYLPRGHVRRETSGLVTRAYPGGRNSAKCLTHMRVECYRMFFWTIWLRWPIFPTS